MSKLQRPPERWLSSFWLGGGAHSREIRQYQITTEGIVIGARFRNYVDLITGLPQPLSSLRSEELLLNRKVWSGGKMAIEQVMEARQATDLPSLCRAVADASPTPMTGLSGPAHTIGYVNLAFAHR